MGSYPNTPEGEGLCGFLAGAANFGEPPPARCVFCGSAAWPCNCLLAEQARRETYIPDPGERFTLDPTEGLE